MQNKWLRIRTRCDRGKRGCAGLDCSRCNNPTFDFELRFYAMHSTQNRTFWRPSSQPISWLFEETKPNTTEANVHPEHKNTTTQNKHKKLNPGLVASHDLPPGNGAGGWRRGVVASVVRRMNEVTLRRARLVLGWVTVFGRVYHHGM